jgi:hypothetical protein
MWEQRQWREPLTEVKLQHLWMPLNMRWPYERATECQLQLWEIFSDPFRARKLKARNLLMESVTSSLPHFLCAPFPTSLLLTSSWWEHQRQRSLNRTHLFIFYLFSLPLSSLARLSLSFARRIIFNLYTLETYGRVARGGQRELWERSQCCCCCGMAKDVTKLTNASRSSDSHLSPSHRSPLFSSQLPITIFYNSLCSYTRREREREHVKWNWALLEEEIRMKESPKIDITLSVLCRVHVESISHLPCVSVSEEKKINRKESQFPFYLLMRKGLERERRECLHILM